MPYVPAHENLALLDKRNAANSPALVTKNRLHKNFGRDYYKYFQIDFSCAKHYQTCIRE
jgi:hypothetical protein